MKKTSRSRKRIKIKGIKDQESKDVAQGNEKENMTKGETEKENEELKRQCDDLTEHLQRLQAEFENYSKRATKDIETARDQGAIEVVKSLLDILDSLDSAIAPVDSDEGLKLLHRNLKKALTEIGLSEINCEGVLDTSCHEVLMRDNNPEIEDGQIVEVLQKGYAFRGKIIRTAKVKVNTLS